MFKNIYKLAYELYLENLSKYHYEDPKTLEFFITYREHNDYKDFFNEAYFIIFKQRTDKIIKLKENIRNKKYDK